ncbi:MAG TPA: hypothetical protein VGO90_16885 [Chthoniobacteraceae bacterium]|nr:hypothetical protein [Chthoniobacteraceae bacterium]
MKTFEERFTAWVDGQLTGTELAVFERELAQHPEAAADYADAQKLGALLRAKAIAPQLTNVDFFNLQIEQRIKAGNAPGAAQSKREKVWGFGFLPRLALGGAFCLLAAFGLFQSIIPSGSPVEKSPYFAQVVEAWPSDPSIYATTVYSAEDNVTVLWLDGLDYLPGNTPLQ